MQFKYYIYLVIGVFFLLSFLIPHLTFWILLLAGIISTINFFRTPNHLETETDTSQYVAFQHEKSAYMKSETWKRKRALVLSRDDYQCQLCGSSENLSVHHEKDYLLIPHEPISSLVTLCQPCHQKEHDTHGRLETYQDFVDWHHPILRKKHG